MLSRSNEILEAQVTRYRKAVLASLGAHLVLGGWLVALIWLERPKPPPVSFEVLEAPSVAPKETSIAHKAAPERTTRKARAVFGISRKALQAQGESSPVTEKLGNTLTKAPDHETLKPDDADTLPTATEDYLVTRMPELVAEVQVPYPPQAKNKGIEGAVVMDLLIDAAGLVRQITLIEGPGEGLNEAAMAAVKGARFHPALVGDKPVAVRIRYSYRFVLEH